MKITCNQRVLMAAFLSGLLLFSGCSTDSRTQEPGVPPQGPSATEAPRSIEADLPENVNEAGRIPIIMYHRIKASESDYDRTPEAFRADLQLLYSRGYRPVSLEALLEGRFDVPVGCSPVVFTFDDGDPSQFRMDPATGQPTPDCAVGIFEAFRKEHPDFDPQATFFVNGGVPFGQKTLLKEKLNYLIERGYLIGNHSFGHEKLNKLDPAAIQKTLGENAQTLEALTGKPVTLLALPYGIRPEAPEALQAVLAGVFDGKPYRNVGICNVGWQPELPPYIQGHDPTALNRVRCGDGEGELLQWLDRMDQTPGLRFISDGDPDTITVPKASETLTDPAAIGNRQLRLLP